MTQEIDWGKESYQMTPEEIELVFGIPDWLRQWEDRLITAWGLALDAEIMAEGESLDERP